MTADATDRAGMRRQLVGIVLTATVPVALLMSWQLRHNLAERQTRLLERLDRAAATVAGDVARELDARRRELRLVGAVEAVQRADAAALRRGLEAAAPGWAGAALFDSAGQAVATVAMEAPAAGALAGAPSADAAAPGRTETVRVWQPSPAASPRVVIEVPLPPGGAAQRLAGWLGDTGWQALLRRTALPLGSRAALLDAQQALLAQTAVAAAGGVAQRVTAPVGTSGWQVLLEVPPAALDGDDRAAVLAAIAVTALCLLGGVTFALLLARRITAHRETQAALIEAAARERLREAERERERAVLMASEQAARRDAEAAGRVKDEFLGVLGHELRNPLSALTAAVQVLERVDASHPMAGNARAVIGRQTQHLLSMMDDLLDAGRVLGGRAELSPRRVDLAALVAAVAEPLRAAGTPGHEWTLRLQPVEVQGDAMRLEQVVRHLLDHALDQTPAGGRIEVDTSADAGQARLQVRDGGPGLPPERLATAFEPFIRRERTPGQSTRLGLGLAMVRRLAELHGGSASVESTATGTVFTVRLPLAP